MQTTNHKTTLQKNSIFLPLLGVLFALFFVGAGCSNTTQEQVAIPEPEETQKVVVKKPAGVDTIDYAIEICTSRGYAPVLKYDKETKVTNTFCKFDDGYACNALGYIMGSCTTTSSNRIYLVAGDGVPDNLRTCTEEEKPVCSKDGVTYVNSCIAALQNAVVDHTGVCTEAEIKLALGDTASTGSGSTGSSGTNTNGSGGEAVAAPPSGTPVWTTYLMSIVGAKSNGPGAPVQKECTYGSTRVFYLVENCPNCFSTLYNNDGAVICHPHNDIANECPSYFNKDNHGGNCNAL